jgi:hypothetical protein
LADDWRRVAEAVRLRRGQLGLRTQKEAAAIAGIGVTTWRQIENAHQDAYRPTILGAVARALQWPADALTRIAAGEPLPAEEEGDLLAQLAGLSARLDRIEGTVDLLLAERAPHREGGAA